MRTEQLKQAILQEQLNMYSIPVPEFVESSEESSEEGEEEDEEQQFTFILYLYN